MTQLNGLHPMDTSLVG